MDSLLSTCHIANKAARHPKPPPNRIMLYISDVSGGIPESMSRKHQKLGLLTKKGVPGCRHPAMIVGSFVCSMRLVRSTRFVRLIRIVLRFGLLFSSIELRE
jgi:hypothetical protein